MLLYLVKHSCSNLVNETRELSKANHGTNTAAYKKILNVIKYILDTKNFRLKIEPMRNSNKPLEIVCFSQRKFAGDPISKRSVSVFILYVLGLPIFWKSKLQKSVSLFS